MAFRVVERDIFLKLFAAVIPSSGSMLDCLLAGDSSNAAQGMFL